MKRDRGFGDPGTMFDEVGEGGEIGERNRVDAEKWVRKDRKV